MTDTFAIYAVIAIAIGAAGMVMLAIAVMGMRPRLLEVADELQATLTGLQRALFHIEELARELRDKAIVDKLMSVLDGAQTALGQVDATLVEAQGAVGRIDPLATDLQATLSEARELLDDATQTSQSVRARVDDLAAAQSELTSMATALTDVISEVRDREVAARLANVLADTSLLAADIGILTENANSYLEHGKPLVSNISGVVDSARRRAGGISSSLGALREGLRGVKAPPDDRAKAPDGR
ncbi:hypothetical protein JW859_10905 [bacterium]|nr:hypothetical protein [bacterium]